MVGADMGEKWWLNVDAGYLRPETIDALMIYNVQKVKTRVVLPQHWMVFDGDAKENTCQETGGGMTNGRQTKLGRGSRNLSNGRCSM